MTVSSRGNEELCACRSNRSSMAKFTQDSVLLLGGWEHGGGQFFANKTRKRMREDSGNMPGGLRCKKIL